MDRQAPGRLSPRQADALIAERLGGWSWRVGQGPISRDGEDEWLLPDGMTTEELRRSTPHEILDTTPRLRCVLASLPRYTSRIEHAWQLLEDQTLVEVRRVRGGWVCLLGDVHATGETAPLAICRAVMMAAKVTR